MQWTGIYYFIYSIAWFLYKSYLFWGGASLWLCPFNLVASPLSSLPNRYAGRLPPALWPKSVRSGTAPAKRKPASVMTGTPRLVSVFTLSLLANSHDRMSVWAWWGDWLGGQGAIFSQTQPKTLPFWGEDYQCKYKTSLRQLPLSLLWPSHFYLFIFLIKQ